MKANKAPEKIYFDGESKACKLPIFSSQNIEYIRKDTFIKKIEKWLNEHADNDDYTWYDEIEHTSGITDKFIEDLKNYMKGE